MKASLAWLRAYAQLDAPLDHLRQVLIDTGTEVDAVHPVAHGAVVARVLALAPVPESTKGVQFADLDAGEAEPVRVLTGAQNLSVGDTVPWARPGTLLPGWDQALAVRPMFGGRYQSPGMLCSSEELGLGDGADGILLLEEGRPGQSLAEVLPLDTVLDVEPTTNRPDLLCHLGLARELAAALGERVQPPAMEIPVTLQSAGGAASRVRLRVDDPQGCPRFMVRVIDDVTVGPSPEWLQRRLRAVGLRPINNVVDVTNYVAAELGQPLHAFDIDRFTAHGGGEAVAQVVVRRGREGDSVECLDGVEREPGPDDLVVCSGERAASLAGIIGGRATAVDGATTRILLEAAAWDGQVIRASSRRLGVRSDASALYEKNLSDTLPALALERAAALIAELGRGFVLAGVVEERPRVLPTIPPIDVDARAVSALLGMPVDADEAATMLVRLKFAVEQDGERLRVTPPHFRRDVTIAEDVVEEIGRMVGYGRLPSTLPGRRRPVRELAVATSLEDTVHEVCLGAGLDEALTYSFQSRALATRLRGLGAAHRPLALRNPLSEDWAVLRTSLLPGLCEAVALSVRRGTPDAALFEVSRVFWEGARQAPPDGSTADGADALLPPLPAEPLLLGVVTHAGTDAGDAATRLRHLQSVAERLSRDLAGTALEVVPAVVDGLRPGRAAWVEQSGRRIGVVGEVDHGVSASFDVRGRLVVLELDLDALAPSQPRVATYAAPSRLPAVVQDLAVLVPADVTAGAALATVRAAGGPLLEGVELWDEFRSARVGAGRKGWTFRLTYRGLDHTLTGAEAQAVQDAIAIALQERHGGEVRR